ncbi:nucleoside phosphorylase [Brevibacillus dissolubilis]|uniref:nucleoside phosphorylase n=1 Tax=Brevibacillus dissolubilis TaxID=1844116 RepID=UPI0011172B5A|nr:nucleoside phosphorylase [Brevibacillus dissolubilis]
MHTPNLLVGPDNLASHVIVCGDPARAEQIAKHLQDAREVAYNREYRTFTGTYQGTPVSITSHGVGASGAAVCFEELIRAGATHIIRVGTAGSYHADLPSGSLVISTASVRTDGLTRQLVPDGFPAVADIGIVQALQSAARARQAEVQTGLTLTLDVFYEGAIPFPHKTYKKSGVLAVEMENSALFVIAMLRGIKAGAIMAIDGFADADLAQEYDPHNDAVKQAVKREAEIALDALALLQA